MDEAAVGMADEAGGGAALGATDDQMQEVIDIFINIAWGCLESRDAGITQRRDCNGSGRRPCDNIGYI